MVIIKTDLKYITSVTKLQLQINIHSDIKVIYITVQTVSNGDKIRFKYKKSKKLLETLIFLKP